MLLFMLRHPKYLTDRQEAGRLLQAALSRPGNGGVENPHVAEWEAKCLLRERSHCLLLRWDPAGCAAAVSRWKIFSRMRPGESAGEKLSERNLRIQDNLIAVSMAGLRQDQHTFINGYTDKNLWGLSAVQRRTGRRGCPCGTVTGTENRFVVRRPGSCFAIFQRNAFCAGQEPGWWSAEIQFREKVIWDVTEMPPYLYQGKAGISILLHQALAQGILPDGEGAWLADRLDRELFRCTDCLAENGGPRVFGRDERGSIRWFTGISICMA